MVAVFALLPLAGGCSDDPPGPAPFGPGSAGQAGTASGSDAGGGATSLNGIGDPKDAAVDHDPGYRDPKGTDAGCSDPNKVCSGKCVAVGSDVDNCGACGNQCTGPGAACNAGACACTGPLFDYCQGQGCMDVSSDTNNCGACGNVCDPNQFNACVSGVCVNNC